MRPLAIGFAVTATACAPAVTQPSPDQNGLGERAYQKCYSCHALEPGRNDLSGPALYRIVGRNTAAEQGFDYSPALRRFSVSNPTWTIQLLDDYIAEPEALVPGTSMTFHGITDPAERRALIDYLGRQTSASAASLP